MAGRAGERAFASAFDVDAVTMRDFEHREPERASTSRSLPSRSIKTIVGISRDPDPGGAEILGEDRGSNAGAELALKSVTAARRKIISPACSAPVTRGAGAGSGSTRKTTTAWVTGRASARSARSRAPSNSSRHCVAAPSNGGTARRCSKPSRSARTTALPPTDQRPRPPRRWRRCRLPHPAR